MYQLSRENEEIHQKISRDDVETLSEGRLTANRVYNIENGQKAYPEDVVIMAEIYHDPKLFNYYCTNECAIGMKFIPKVETIHDLPQITMQLLANLNSLNRDKERIIDIVADGEISENETEDFELFRKHIAEMELAIQTLKLWVEKKQIKHSK